MPVISEMENSVTFRQQMGADTGPVIFMNKFTVASADIDQFLRAWKQDAALIKLQPGLISIQLHRGILGSGVFMNHAVWESTKAYRTFVESGVLTARQSREMYPESLTMSPHLFEKIAVEGICVA